MTGLLTKIRDYDRLLSELDEARENLAQAKARLEEMEAELDKLRSQLDSAHEKLKRERKRKAKEEERRGKVEDQLEKKKQEIAKLESRIEELGRRVETNTTATLSEEAEVEGDGVKEFVGQQRFPSSGICISAKVPDEEFAQWIDSVPGMAPWASRVAGGRKGLLVFACGTRAVFLEPPLPLKESQNIRDTGFDFSVLENSLGKPRVGFISLHRDRYAVCLLNGALEKSKLERKSVLGRSSKGGFSQARFSRSRQDQAKHLFLEADGEIKGILGDENLEYVLLEGDDVTVSSFLESSESLDERDVVRYTMSQKLSRDLLDRLPSMIWRWRAWVFDLPSPVT